MPTYNSPILTIAQIIINVISSTAEAELVGLFICAKEMVPIRKYRTEMGCPQPKSPIQCDKSTAVGVANKTTIPQKTQVNGHAIPLYSLQGLPSPVQILLGSRIPTSWRLQLQEPPANLSPLSAKNQTSCALLPKAD